MEQKTKDLLHKILETCMTINEQGKWHAFFDHQGHTGSVSVYVNTADLDYQSDRDLWPPRENKGGYTHALWADHDYQNELGEIMDWLSGYLEREAA